MGIGFLKRIKGTTGSCRSITNTSSTAICAGQTRYLRQCKYLLELAKQNNAGVITKKWRKSTTTLPTFLPTSEDNTIRISVLRACNKNSMS